jgi:general secretion pathway protein M
MNGLNPRERKLLAVGLLVLAIAALWLAVASPILNGFAARAEQRRNLLAAFQRNQRLIDAIPAWRAEAEGHKRSASAYAIVAASQIEAQEQLRQRLAAALTGDPASPPSVQDMQSDLPSGWIGARADAALTATQLYAGLRRLQSEEPYVVVESLSINADRAFHTGQAGPLDVRLEISSAFRLSGAGQP